ncbi:type VII toxin-antitoxin system HepT family RNase toxin [Paenibacillus sabuli]
MDVLINKMAIIDRCIARIEEEYAGDDRNLHNMTKQDSIILNIQRVCEACIDLAMHAVAKRNFGVPQSSRDAFDLLQTHRALDEEQSKRMKAMVGFRNIAVHDYQAVNMEIVKKIVAHHLEDCRQFAEQIQAYLMEA